ncbi:MAG: MFS transporter [Gemmatimonadetes bacterium]|nr:MFS transporter [Gemmatimonadota bacterium]
MEGAVTLPRSRGLLHTLGLHRKELRSWAMYDWAKSSFETTMGAAVFPIYYSAVAAATLPKNVASAYWGYTNSISLLLVTLAAPVLGAMADYLGAKKRFLAFFLGMGVLATAGLFLVTRGEWLLGSGLFVIAAVGVTGSTTFNDSLLPHIARSDEVDRVSTGAYAMGYLGGGLLLAINALMISQPARFGFADAGAATRAVFLTVAVWWVLFAIPVFRNVAEPVRRLEAGEAPRVNPVRVGFKRLRETLGELRQYRELLKFLVAYWLYIDGIHTIQKMATVYGTELGIGQGALIGALLLVQFVGIPFTFMFGALAGRIGRRRGLYLALAVYTGIAIAGYFVREAWHFWALAVAVGLVQGGAQGLSRSLYATMIPKAKSSEFFSFFSIFERFGGILGPAVFGIVGTLMGTSRFGILALVAFFIAGILLLSRVDIEAGQRAAAHEDAELRPLSAGAVG